MARDASGAMLSLTKVYILVYTSYMNTTFIGVKDFRQNMSDYARRAQKGETRFVIMNHNKPLFEIKPFAEDEHLDSFVASVLVAEAEVTQGKYYTHEEVMRELGIA